MKRAWKKLEAAFAAAALAEEGDVETARELLAEADEPGTEADRREPPREERGLRRLAPLPKGSRA